MPRPEALEYVLPLRWENDEGLDELTAYLRRLSEWVEVTVVDGSPAPGFDAHRRAWPFVRHVPPAVPGANGKARGAMTGIGISRHERIVIADDDVRYERAELLRIGELLHVTDFVRPQNVFHPLPWHARWDTGRSLLNRPLGGRVSGKVGAGPLRFAELFFDPIRILPNDGTSRASRTTTRPAPTSSAR